MFSYQSSVRRLATAILDYHIASFLSRTFFKFFRLFSSFVMSLLVEALLFYHCYFVLSRTFFKFFRFFRNNKRRKRDLNPRAAINDLLPFQGSPFSLLGISPKPVCLSKTERVGFEPTRPLGQTVFKTASL